MDGPLVNTPLVLERKYGAGVQGHKLEWKREYKGVAEESRIRGQESHQVLKRREQSFFLYGRRGGLAESGVWCFVSPASLGCVFSVLYRLLLLIFFSLSDLRRFFFLISPVSPVSYCAFSVSFSWS